MKRALLLILLLTAAAGQAAAATFVVTNTNDSGPGSLRQAIMDANANDGLDAIHFNIPSGSLTIRPTEVLPTITDRAYVFGETQPGFSGVPLIEINGDLVPPGHHGLKITAGSSRILNIVINGFRQDAVLGGGHGVVLEGGGGNLVWNNIIGTNRNGTSAVPNQGDGVRVSNSSGNSIGCAAREPPDFDNLISGNGTGIRILGASDFNDISGNTIGLDSSGSSSIPNTGAGVEIVSGDSNRLGAGGCSVVGNATFGNVISGNGGSGIVITAARTIVTDNLVGWNTYRTDLVANAGDGIRIDGGREAGLYRNRIGGNGLNGIRLAGGASQNVIGGASPNTHANFIGFNSANGVLVTDVGTEANTVLGNFIGARSDLGPAPNASHGIAITNGASGNTIGGTTTGFGNRIFFNGGAGVFVESGAGNAIRGNGIALSGGLGIDLAPLGVTPNDVLDPDAGPNLLQNFPVLNSAIGGDGQTVVTGTLQSFPDSDFHIDFFASADCDGSGNGEGGVYLGSTLVATDGAGDASINAVLPVVSPGRAITATATDGAGNTSEFSACVFTPLPVVSVIQPDSGSAAGGTPFGIVGQNFQTGAAVTVGGVAAPNVTVFNPENIGVESPALSPGTLNPVTVTNPDAQAGTLPNAFLADFTDVSQLHAYHDYVEQIFRAGITGGCGGGNYCVDAPVRRDQMAVFLLIAKNGSGYVPPPATGMVFHDVPTNAFAAAFIEELAALQVTAGCGNGNYCPTLIVTRDQMAVFLLRAFEGPSYTPPACTTSTFLDVPCSSPFAIWVEELVNRGITAGCGPGFYCPFLPISRGEMAVFLVVTFGL